MTDEEKAFRAGFLCRPWSKNSLFFVPQNHKFSFDPEHSEPHRTDLVDHAWASYQAVQEGACPQCGSTEFGVGWNPVSRFAKMYAKALPEEADVIRCKKCGRERD